MANINILLRGGHEMTISYLSNEDVDVIEKTLQNASAFQEESLVTVHVHKNGLTYKARPLDVVGYTLHKDLE